MNAEYIGHDIIMLEYDRKQIHMNQINNMSLTGTTTSDNDNETFSLELTVSIANANDEKFFILVTRDTYRNAEKNEPDLKAVTDQYMIQLFERTDTDIESIVNLLNLSFINIPKISELNQSDFVERN